MLKIYSYNGLTFQFEDGKAPEGAVEIAPKKPEPKEAEKPNKAAAKKNK